MDIGIIDVETCEPYEGVLIDAWVSLRAESSRRLLTDILLSTLMQLGTMPVTQLLTLT